MKTRSIIPIITAVFLACTPSGSHAQPKGKKGEGASPRFSEPQWLMPPVTGANLHYKTFASKAAGTNVSYLIYLPPDYESAKDRRYPVVYWLHGIGGSQQGVPLMAERLTKAIEQGKTPPMIVVYVNGMVRSSYVDSANGKWPVETVTIKELIPHIDQTYRTLATRASRMVEGFSMGGGGAAKWGFKYPELFGSVSIFAGALFDNSEAMSRRDGGKSLQEIYGSAERFEASNPWKLVEKNLDQIRGRTVIRIVVGEKDGLKATNERYHELLDRLGLKHEFHVIPGAIHSPNPLYEGLGDKNWEFFKTAFGEKTASASATPQASASQPSAAQRPPARNQTPARPSVPDGVKAFRDLSYVQNGHERHVLDLFVPEQPASPLPLLIWIHGGGWQNGSKEGCPPLRNGYTGRGYAVASINYRLSGQATFPAQIEDCKAAIRWLRSHAKEYTLDPTRFGVWGSSAGGHLVALVGTSGDVKEFDVGANLDQSSRVQAVCDYYGPTDLLKFVGTTGYESHAKPDSPESKLLGGTVAEVPERAARANPITFVSPDDPPFLIVHGDQDRTVPINQSQLLFDALKKAGTRVRFHTIEGAGHGSGFGGQELETMVSSFFDRHLKGVAIGTEESLAFTTRGLAFTPPGGAASPQAPPGASRASAQSDTKAGARRGMAWEQVRTREGVADDGRVTREKFKGPPPLFDRLDRNRDGLLSKEDFGGETTEPKGSPASASSASTSSSTPESQPVSGKKFELNGERWTYREGDFVMSGILLKPEGKGPFPAILISHGLGGSSESFGLSKAREFVKWGFVCIAPDYTHSAKFLSSQRGGAPKGGAPKAAPKTGAPVGKAGRSNPEQYATYGASAENLRRGKTCVEILCRLPEVDAKRIAAYGHSMGGFVTIGLAAKYPDMLKAAAVSGSGVAPRTGFPAPSAEAAEAIRTPFLMLHGGSDPVVRPEQSASLKTVLDRNKVPNDRRVFEGVGHPVDRDKSDEVFALMRQWFTTHGVPAAPGTAP